MSVLSKTINTMTTQTKKMWVVISESLVPFDVSELPKKSSYCDYQNKKCAMLTPNL